MPYEQIDQQAAIADNAGNPSQPVPTDDSERAKRREQLRAVNPKATDEPQPKADQSTSAGEKQNPEIAKQEKPQQANPKVGLPKGVQRRIDSQHRELQTLKQKYAELEAMQNAPKPTEKPKLKRENFVSEEDYISHVAEQKADELMAKKLAEYEERNQTRSTESRESQAVVERIAKKKLEEFASDPDALDEFEELASTAPDNLPDDVHDFVLKSPHGLRILHILFRNPQLVDYFNGLDAIDRRLELRDMQKAVDERLSAPIEEPKRNVTKAPAPIGAVGVGGIAKTNGEMSMQERLLARRKETKGW